MTLSLLGSLETSLIHYPILPQYCLVHLSLIYYLCDLWPPFLVDKFTQNNTNAYNILLQSIGLVFIPFNPLYRIQLTRFGLGSYSGHGTLGSIFLSIMNIILLVVKAFRIHYYYMIHVRGWNVRNIWQFQVITVVLFIQSWIISVPNI